MASRLGVAWQTADGVQLTSTDVEAEILRTAFEMTAPAPGERESEVATLADGSRALVLLSGVSLADFDTVAEADRTALQTAASRMNAERDYAGLLQSLRLDASIDAIDLSGTPDT